MIPGKMQQFVCVVVLVAAVASRLVAEPQRDPATSSGAVTGVGAGEGPSLATLASDDWISHLRPVPANATRTRHYYRMATGEQFTGEEGLEAMSASGAATGGADDPVYSCTPPLSNNWLFILGVNSGFPAADDITTVAVGGCDLEAFELVGGGGGDGSGPGFGIEFALYDACPGANGQPIAGTTGQMSFDNDGLHLLLIDLHDSPIPMEKSFYVGILFDPDSGWLAGVPASIGFTENQFHHPFFPCTALFPPPVYGGLYFVAHCGPTEREFLAYRDANIFGAQLDLGDNNWIIDDVQLIGGIEDNTCFLSSYTVAGVGSGTPFSPVPFTITAELRTSCESGSVIDGTQRAFSAVGDGKAEVAQFEFLEPVELPPGQDFFLAFKYSAPARVIVSGDPDLGFTDPFFTYEDGCGDGMGGQIPCAQCRFSVGAEAVGFYASFRCLGEAPLGACCDLEGLMPGDDDPEAELCVNVKVTACRGPLTQYSPGAKCPGTCSESFDRCQANTDCPQGQTCELDSPFDPPCGHFACCLPVPGPMGSCENMTGGNCLAAGGDLDGMRTCGDDGQECGWFGCRNAVGDCCRSRDTVGCMRQEGCCNLVCDIDSWCCTVRWDAICRDEARALCSFDCPGAEIGWLDPPNGVVDARQPHPPDDPDNLQGIDTIRVQGPHDVSPCCWSLCETDKSDGPNFISDVQEPNPGEYTVLLGRPITPGAVTFISYSEVATAAFAAHPGNVNDDSESAPSDILALIDSLNDVVPTPWGIYSCDVDHSGECNPADILRVVDLLNGAAMFSMWNGTPRPDESAPCGN